MNSSIYVYDATFVAGDDAQALAALSPLHSWVDKLRLDHGTSSMEEARRVCEADATCSCGEEPQDCREPLGKFCAIGDGWAASSHSGACGRLSVSPVKGGWLLRLDGRSNSRSAIEALMRAGWAVQTEVAA